MVVEKYRVAVVVTPLPHGPVFLASFCSQQRYPLLVGDFDTASKFVVRVQGMQGM
jgi:hypothetical protein